MERTDGISRSFVSKLDYVVATHPDADHIRGLIDIVNSFTIGQFIKSGKVHTTQTYEELLSIVLAKH
ncbi:MBL fold metallo-hydrolase [Psychrobacillus sp. FSL K6-1415]|uniref:MBL fold metallo-hydrolase n=1 Tax=Psychrobacillus sp. FSL K6-1415 TaxID=2921544 RepID=UPI0030F89F8C